MDKMNPDDVNMIIDSSVCECQIKLELLNDYLERFRIRDARITAPIKDIERCVDVMVHVLHDHQKKGGNFEKNM